jgi:hypothetical protein
MQDIEEVLFKKRQKSGAATGFWFHEERPLIAEWVRSTDPEGSGSARLPFSRLSLAWISGTALEDYNMNSNLLLCPVTQGA